MDTIEPDGWAEKEGTILPPTMPRKKLGKYIVIIPCHSPPKTSSGNLSIVGAKRGTLAIRELVVVF